MTIRRTLSLYTALWLQIAPLAARLEPVAASVAQPIVLLLRWLAGGTLVSGAFHGLSAATGITTATPVSGTTGVPLAYRVAVNSSQHGNGKAYTAKNIPPGLKLSLAGNFTGTPTASGSYVTRVTAWQNSNASGDSATLNLTFNITGSPPVIINGPQDLSVNTGSSAGFSVTASGEAPLTYRWLKEDLELAVTTTNLSFASVTAADAGRYRVRVTSPGGVTLSAFATLTVTAPTLPPTVTTSPQSQTVNAGSSVSFAVTVSGQGPFNYAWLKNDVALGGSATNQTLTLNNVADADAGAYRVRVSNAGGNTLSDPATLTVVTLPPPPTITTQPGSQSVNAGASATFTVGVSGTGPFSFAWLKNDVALGGSATNQTLTLGSVTAADEGAYRVRVSNAGGNTLSDPATLTLAGVTPPPGLAGQTTNVTLYAGETAHLSLNLDPATALQAVTVEWRKDGILLPEETALSLGLTNVTTNLAGVYLPILKSAGGSTAGAPIQVTVLEPLTLSSSGEVDHIHISYRSVPGREYILEGIVLEEAGGWQILQNLKPLTESDETLELFGSNPHRYYRLRAVPLP